MAAPTFAFLVADSATMPRPREDLPKELNFNGREVRLYTFDDLESLGTAALKQRAQPARPGRAGPRACATAHAGGERRAAGAVADHRPVPAHGRGWPGGVAAGLWRAVGRSQLAVSSGQMANRRRRCAGPYDALRAAPESPAMHSFQQQVPVDPTRITPRSVPPAHSPQYAAPGHAGAPRPDQAADAEAAEIRRRAQGQGSLW